MAVFMFFLFLFSLHGVEAQTNHYNISLGSSISPASSNSSWLSPSGLYAFGFYKEGNGFAVGVFLAGIPDKTVVWTANRDQDHVVPNDATLLLTTDGRLILQAQGKVTVIANPFAAIDSASMLDSGNFVLYNSDRRITWQSFDHPTDTLLPGQRLSADQELVSRASETDYSKGIFRLVMQSDGNLVQYPVNIEAAPQYAYYNAETDKYGNQVTLNLEDDGSLYLLNNSTEIIKNITQGRPQRQRTVYTMRLDVDGIFRVYSVSLDKGNLTAVYESTTDKCSPNGVCGVNGFCVLMDQAASCQCLPGFDFIHRGNPNSGCERNFTPASCKAINQSMEYVMQRSENIFWENPPSYSDLETVTVEDCEQKCIEDCNCEVALFKDQKCQKQRLPLIFGRRNNDDFNIVLTKVGLQQSNGNEYSAGTTREKTKEQHTIVLIVGISLIVLAILVLVISGVVFYRSRKWSYNKINEGKNVEVIDDISLRAFSYSELERLTNNFNEELGNGASGTVYKGILLQSQKVVAVKKLEKELAEGEKEFQTEIKVIGRTHHRNLVRLVGYCIDGPTRLLVYQFMERGSLADVLFNQENRLSWMERVGIATDIARGLRYLHEECETQIIHCDIKPQNILMDENMCAKIADFGISKLLKQDQTRTHTGVRGTKGYVAPEWYRKLPVTVKADVYSFGIMLLEIICHRKSVDWSLGEEEAVLEEWVYGCFMGGKLGKLVNGVEVEMKMVERWVKVGIWCIQEEPSLRPSMKNVLLMLEGTIEIPLPPTPSSFLNSL